jgi:cation transport ATPase
VGLDCPACSLAAYEILKHTEGVEQATANFHEGRAVAWIDPARTDRAKVIESLKQRQVTIGE